MQHLVCALLNDAQVCQQVGVTQLLPTQQRTHSVSVAALHTAAMHM
jgi:hypothetical protein